MKLLSKCPLVLIIAAFLIFTACGSDDEGGDPPRTPEQIQTAKLIGQWEPGTVIQEIDGDITDDRFADFSIAFGADAQGNNKSYTIVNTGGEAFEAGTKSWDYVDGNLNRIIRLDNDFEFAIALTNNDTELQITLTVDESGSPLGRTSNTTGGYSFNLDKTN
jgi:hypothetical protein